MSVGTIFLDAEHAIEVAAEDALKALTATDIVLTKVAAASPKVLAALAVLLAQTEVAVGDVSAAAAGGLTVTLDEAAAAAFKASWTDLKAFVATMGINL